MKSYLQMGWFWRGDRAREAAGARPEMRTGEPAYSAVMSQSDPTAVLAGMKRTEALLRDARSGVLRALFVGPRADGCPRGRSIWSCPVSRLERDRSCRRTTPDTRA
jgi:hypothetical protein